MWMGQPKEAIRRMQEAMRLNPYYPKWYLWNFAWAQFLAHGEVR